LAAPRVFVVLIKARETSWLAITVDGMQIMNETLVAPGEKSVEGQKEVVIRAGDVGALDFFFNGKKISVQGDYGQAETLVFDANGLQSTAAKPEPREKQRNNFMSFSQCRDCADLNQLPFGAPRCC
jgi:hypothetical protein